MVRAFVLVVLAAASSAFAQDAPPFTIIPTTRPSAATGPAVPATRPSLEQLHAQAYEFMAAGKFDRATAPFNRVYNDTPPAQRSRALVLNRAILDLVQKQNVVRGVKDLNDYLARNPQLDEQANDILGAALDLIADNPKWRAGPVYASALREFARREAALERTRPGLRRWGDQWITEAKLQEVKQQQKELADEAEAAYQLLDRRTKDLQSITVQYTEALTQFGGFRFHRHLSRTEPAPYRADCPVCAAYFEARDSVEALSRDVQVGTARVREADIAYRAALKRQIKPTWPKRFGPIDPAAPPPPPPTTPSSAVISDATATPFGVNVAPAATKPATAPFGLSPSVPGQSPGAP
jgi:hypothetical protein